MPQALDVHWMHGSPRSRRHAGGDPPLQVHRHDEHTYVLRQSMSVHYEAPFLYLLFGEERALLLDSGATADPARFPLRATVDRLLDQWLAEHPRSSYELVVAHSHGHGDHVAGDGQLADRPATTVVGTDLASVQAFFGFSDWPAQVVTFDLGGRPLAVTGIPGHHAASIALHDPRTGWLLTGDTVYPGRLYVADAPAMLDSLDRLVAMARERGATQVMGCHVEMRREPGRDFPIGATYQPGERALPMTVRQLEAVRDAFSSVADRPGVHRFDDVIVFNGPCVRARLWHVVRLAAGTARDRLRG